MDGKQEPGIGNGDGAASAVSASPATVASSTRSPRKRKQNTGQTSPVERLEIFQSAFNDVAAAGIPAQSLKSHNGITLIYRIGARLCPQCEQPRPLWHFNGNICRECQP